MEKHLENATLLLSYDILLYQIIHNGSFSLQQSISDTFLKIFFSGPYPNQSLVII